MTQTLDIQIFSDPACPWCLVGLYRLNKAIERLEGSPEITFTHHPYFLDADAPLEQQNIGKLLEEKYGRPPGEMWDRLEQEAAKSGLVLDMRKQTTRYSTLGAESLIAAASRLGTQHAIAWAMSEAYYIDARNMADTDVLVDIAVKYGFEAHKARAIVENKQMAEVLKQMAAQASSQGIQGVPFFIFGQQFSLNGAQPDEVFDEALAKALSA